MADDLERLVAQFDADVSRFEKNMTKMGVAFQKQADDIARKQKDLTTKLNSGWSKLNFGGFQKALLGGLSIAALGSFINKTTELTDSILKMSHATGLSTDTFQEWSIVAKKNEVDQDALVTSLERFTKNLGDAQLGTGQFAKILSALGVSAKGTVEDVFLRFIDAANKIQSPTQRAAVLAQAFGKGWADAAGFINLGSDAIRNASDEAKKLGQVIGGDTIKKIDDLSDAWTSLKAQLETIGANALGGFADEFKKFAGDVNSPEFKQSMKEFGESLAKIAGLLVKIAPALPAITGAFIGGRIAGVPGAFVGAAVGGLSQLPEGSVQSKIAVQQRNLKNFQDQLRSQQSLPTWAQWLNGPYSADELIKKIAETKAKIADLQNQLKGPKAPGPAAAVAKPAGGGRNLDLTGALLPPDFLNPVRVTPAVRNPMTPDEEQTFKAQQDVIRAGQDQVDQYNEQISLLGKVDGAAAAAAFKQETLNHLAQEFGTDSEAYRQGAKDVEYFGKQIEDAGNRAAEAQEKFDAAAAVSDEIRSGLSDVGTAALHGFKSAEQAAGQFLERLAEMILQLYVIKPLLDSILGKPGTVIGGGNSFSGVGSFLSSLFQFADGGVMTSRGPLPLRKYASGGIANSPQLAMFGEGSGPEAFIPLKNGGIPVHIRMPSIPKASAAGAPIISVSIPVDARGAQEGVADQIDRKLRAVAPAIVQAAVSQSRKEFPTNMKRSMRDTM